MENVTVRMHGHCTALSWEHDGARFHIWEPIPDVLYKNPPEGTVYKGEGYFPTRQLNLSAKVNAAMIAEARATALANGLYEKAMEQKAQEKALEEQQQRDAIALQKKKDRAENMFAALQNIASLWPDPPDCAELVPKWVGPNDGRMRADLLWFALNAAREALEMPTYPRPAHWDKAQIVGTNADANEG